MDTPLLIISALLVTSLGAFFAGLSHYPYGWLVLSLFFFARLWQLQANKNNKDKRR